MTEFLDLVTKGGELIKIECPDKYVDELYESLENAKSEVIGGLRHSLITALLITWA